MDKDIELNKKASGVMDKTLNVIDKELCLSVPDNEQNRRVIAKMRDMPLKDLYIWKGIYEKLIACEKCMNKKPTKDYHYSPDLTLKYYEHEIKLRERE